MTIITAWQGKTAGGDRFAAGAQLNGEKGKAHVLKTHDIALFPFAAEMNQAIVYTRPTKTKRA